MVQLEAMFLPLAILGGIGLRAMTGIHSYSGQNTPPMYGDYEAQRHFMEVSYSLPISQWYTYDLQYWGLDYPPLTAYHSWAMGWLADRGLGKSEWVALNTSRGYESPKHKLFMRGTSLVSDLLTYGVAAWMFTRYLIRSTSTHYERVSEVDGDYLLVMLMFQPALIIIDHGHFQYNAVMLGLTLFSLTCLLKQKYVMGSALFCAAIMYKHMALYYSLAFFAYLLGECYKRIKTEGFGSGLWLLIKLGVTVAVTFGAIFYPFYAHAGGMDGVVQVVRRLFPFERGLYEDKVANFWCALRVAVKLEKIFPLDILVNISGIATLIACSTSCWVVFKNPKPRVFIKSLATISLGFFLFSFQVHEKSILLPLLPVTLLYLDEPVLVEFFVNVAMFSIYPLLKKDGLVLAYVALTGLWNVMSRYQSWHVTDKSAQKLIYLVYAGMAVSHICDAMLKPPARLPDLFVMMNVIVSCTAFIGSWLYLHLSLFADAIKLVPSPVKKTRRSPRKKTKRE